MEFDKLNEKLQDQIREILWLRADGNTKEVTFGLVEEWIADGDCDWTPEQWIEEAKRASL